MLQFIKDALRELKHVVWPTRKETQKFFGLTLIILVLFGTYLFIASNIFSTIVFGLKDMFGVSVGNTPVSSSLSDEEIDALFSAETDLEINTSTGTQSDTVNTGAIDTQELGEEEISQTQSASGELSE